MAPAAAALLALFLLLAPRGGPAAARSFALTASAENAGAVVITRPAWQQILPNTPVGTPQITVVKSVIGSAPVADWAFNGSPDIGNFTLPATGGNETFGDLAIGDYTISETDVGGWVVEASCAPGGETGSDSVTVTLADGDAAVTCTFTNTLCLAGTYDNGTACVDAGPGYYVDTDGATAQIECWLGTYSSSPGAVECVAADPGHYAKQSPADGQIACEPGTYQPSTNGYFCYRADEGFYVPGSGATQQTPCEPGKYQNEEGQDFCKTAEPGTYTDNYGSVFYSSCSSGTYQPNWGQTFCYHADPGNYVPNSGSAQQYPCAAGTVQPNDGQSSCRGAYPGYYAPNSGMADELPCEPGTYQDEHGQTSCKPAPAGTYAPDPAMTAPLNCPSGYTSEEGATECYAATADLTITKGTDPAGGTGFPFTLDPGTVTFEHKWGTFGVAAGEFVSPSGVAVDGAGNVYVVDTFAYRVQKFDAGGNFLRAWGRDVVVGGVTGFEICTVAANCKAGTTGSGDGEFNLPSTVTIVGTTVYVADSFNHRIQMFDLDGNYIDQWGGGGGGGGQFSQPNGLAADGAGNIYVADAANNRVQKFDADGDFLLAWGRDVVAGGGTDFEICTPSDTCKAGVIGSGNGQFETPFGVVVVGAVVYVADTFNHRIQTFDTDGVYQDQWGGSGSGDGQFDRPYRITADGAGNLYVADTGNERIQKFDSQGGFLTKWGSGGGGDGEFDFPLGVAAAAGDVYVVEYNNHRVQRFRQTGALLDDGQSHTFDDLAPGTYLVSELVPDGWTLDDVTCDGGSPAKNGNTVEVTLAAGDDVNCTFTNTEDTPPPATAALTIVKSVSGTGAPDDWSFSFNGSLGGFSLTDEDPDRAETLLTPGLFVFGETNPTGYTTTVSCDNGDSAADGNLSVTLAAGDDVECTFTNAICQPGNFDTATSWACAAADPGHFVSTVGAAAQTACAPGFYQPGAGAIECIQADPGFYAPGPAATEQTACPSGTTSLAGSDSVDDCVATTGTIIIEKSADPDDGHVFAFNDDIENAGGFFLEHAETKTFANVPAGQYSVLEYEEDGWTLDQIDCDDTDSTGSIATRLATINLSGGETVTCTFYNSRDTGTIIIVKDATPADDTPFSFTEDILNTGFTLTDPSDNTETFNNVPTGSYTVTETVPAPWLLDDIDCDDANSTENEAAATATIQLEKGETVTCTFSNTNGAPPQTELFFSGRAAGTTGDGLAFGPHDILRWDGNAWSKWFSGDDAGLVPNGKAKHNINAFWIPDPTGSDVVLSFGQNARRVPGIVPKVDGMDLVWWDGSSFSLYFDGSDVDLIDKTQEKIDALHVLPGSASPIGGACQAYLLISTQGPGKVRGHDGASIKFGGEDVLGFCATNLGEATAGVWHLVLDGSAEGMPRNSTVSLSASDDGRTLYLTTRAAFDVDAASGGHSMVYAYDFGTGEFSGPVFVPADEGLPGTVNGLQVEGDLP